MSNVLRFSVCLCALLFVSGCGSDQIPVWPTSGVVVFSDGSKVKTGNIEFESLDHELTASGRIRPDGSFVLGTYTPDDGAVAGIHNVIVVQMVINDGTINHTMDHGKPVPPMYASYETSGLAAMVTKGKSNNLTVTIELPERN